ncbi:MAG: T9SS type A sorting domain-containing protein [Parabacteroides sp.]|nr:T9SS type A sorting domain-containing protein [Parabacteroides sp.]
MKKKILYSIPCLLANIFFLNIHHSLYAQIPTPSTWESFVNSTNNTFVCDTFLLQTFGKSTTDNWEFTLNENSSIVQDKNTLKIPVGSSVTFQPFSHAIYTDIKIAIHIAGLNLSPNDSLLFDVHRNQMNVRLAAHTPNKDKNYLGYQYFTVGQNPNSFTIDTHQASQSSIGYYMTDSIFAYGNIPSYSLFTGSGNWDNTIFWSHLPAYRYRNALIKGDVSIIHNTHCQNLALSSGKIEIHPNTSLSINNLDLYGTDNSILSKGEMNVLGQITLHKTFEETGKWYFISFPFDVYSSGIDPNFTQKDDTPNEGGNYFYVQTYNGDKRATTNHASNNWEVLSIQSEDKPLFEKNKGYLIALDEKAIYKTLSFSSKQGDIPSNFGQTGSITIPIETTPNAENQENYGWYLCGNPLPAPLVLSRIKNNTTLDGNIYIYDGESYQPYEIGSNHALPPYSSFFIKASSPTTLEITPENDNKTTIKMIDTERPVYICVQEPHIVQSTQTDILNKNIFYSIKEKQLYLQHLLTPGEIKLFNLLGQCVWKKNIQAGTHFIPMNINSGIYILQIRTENSTQRSKIRF